MGNNSNIAWTDHTFNPWIGCTKVSPGCANCYAAAQDNLRKWTPNGWGKGKPRRRTSETNWTFPLKWNKEAAQTLIHECGFRENYLHTPDVCPKCKQGAPSRWRPRVFTASLADWLDDEIPIEWLADLLALIYATPNLDWLLLTKRPENWQERIFEVYKKGYQDPLVDQWIEDWAQGEEPPANIWLGATVENQEMADRRIPELLKIPAKVRFLSCEPLLGPIELSSTLAPELEVSFNGNKEALRDPQFTNAFAAMIKAAHRHFHGIHWVIAGGESGPGRREMDLGAMESLHAQCVAAGVPFFCKQDSGPHPGRQGRIPDAIWNTKQFPNATK